ncbi:MAG: putative glycoside hydrolase [Terriglobales bacterium]
MPFGFRAVAALKFPPWVALLAGLCAAAAAQVPVTGPASTRHPTPPNLEIRAIYFTGLMAGSAHGKQLAEQWRAQGGNAIVFDVKDSDGPVSFNSSLPLAGHLKHPYISDLPEWINWLHEHGLYAIARMAVFKDERLVHEHPELAVRSRSTGGIWLENGKATWTDPSLEAVQNYNIHLAVEVANAGADEIQFDYIRFPVDGNQKDARFTYQAAAPATPRADFISNYLYRAQQALKPSGVHISIDVYGVMAWAREVDLAATGQDVVSLAYFCDVMCPMIYPSHFFGDFDGIADPGDAPEHFIHEGMERFNSATQDTGVVIRPWLQAFAWRTKTFGTNYILIQVAAERAQHGGGFMLWNAGNKYPIPFAAMPTMVAGGDKYFTGGFPYAITALPAAAASSGGRPARSPRAPR